MNDNNTLTAAFSEIAKEHGYTSVTAEFSEFKEFKAKCRRSIGWIEFEVSDYLKGAPEDVLKGLAETIFNRISRRSTAIFSDAMIEWVHADAFIEKNRPLYLRRAKNIARTHVGEHRDLNASYQRLIDMGLVQRDDNAILTWTKQPNVTRIGYCSVMMKVVIISSIFDTLDIPEYVLDYVVYHELIHVDEGIGTFDQKHDENFRAKERKFPLIDDAEDWLKKLRLYL